ncbi:MAG: hypothetical protein AUJ97_07340 [Bacteroidetes bacterium CG2_30_32_10]|nr:MAG: hypothetical protein AUJ97_07340 [Bacteroidetes bacterium CG2_30_32_10]
MKTRVNSNKRPQTNYYINSIIFIICFIYLAFCNANSLFAQSNEQLEQNNSVFSTSSPNSSSSLFNSFESIALEGNVYLKWYVIDKNNSKTYLIERSEDGVSFETKGAIKVNGGKYNIEILNCFVDKTPLMGYSYYRIVASNEFGNKEFSATNMVYNEAPAPKVPINTDIIFVNNTILSKE